MAVEPKSLPMEEAKKFWRDKVRLSPGEFNRLSAEAKLRAFAVAGIAKGDELSTVFAAMQRAIDDGISFDRFKKDCAEIFERRGWTGKRAWRVDNIFRTNIQIAYQVGRYQQMRRVAKLRPFWRYDAVGDRRTRPTHRALDGKVFPADHPFWDNWYPPNGFRCRCSVTTLSRRQMEKQGVKVETDDPTNTMIHPIDPTTGKPHPVPVQLLPDPGFAYHPGKSYWAGLTPAEMDGEILPLIGKAICGRSREYSDGRCKPLLAEIDPRHILPFTRKDLLPPGLPSEDYVRVFLREFGIRDINGQKLIILPGESGLVLPVNKGFFIDRRTGAWKVTKHGRERYIKLLARTIKNPYEAWLVPAEVSGRKYTVTNLIRLFGRGDEKIGGFCVWSLVGNRWLSSTVFAPQSGKTERQLLNYLESQRVGRLLYREKL